MAPARGARAWLRRGVPKGRAEAAEVVVLELLVIYKLRSLHPTAPPTTATTATETKTKMTTTSTATATTQADENANSGDAQTSATSELFD